MICIAVTYDTKAKTFRLLKKDLEAALMDSATCDLLIPADLGMVEPDELMLAASGREAEA